MIIRLEFESEVPIYMQLRNQIVIGIGKGELAPGEGLPTVRQMAVDIGVNTMTVNKAYGLLKTEGFISIDRRHGAKVNDQLELDAHRMQQVSHEVKEKLEMAIAEGSIKGMQKRDFVDLCENIFNEMKVLKV